MLAAIAGRPLLPAYQSARIDPLPLDPDGAFASVDCAAKVEDALVNPAGRRQLPREEAERIGHPRQERRTDVIGAMDQPVLMRDAGVEEDAVQMFRPFVKIEGVLVARLEIDAKMLRAGHGGRLCARARRGKACTAAPARTYLRKRR